MIGRHATPCEMPQLLVCKIRNSDLDLVFHEVSRGKKTDEVWTAFAEIFWLPRPNLCLALTNHTNCRDLSVLSMQHAQYTLYVGILVPTLSRPRVTRLAFELARACPRICSGMTQDMPLMDQSKHRGHRVEFCCIFFGVFSLPRTTRRS